jgi:uncharacterized protein YbaA (DUF1428 family)
MTSELDMTRMCYLIGFVVADPKPQEASTLDAYNFLILSLIQRLPKSMAQPVWVYSPTLNTVEVFCVDSDARTEGQWRRLLAPLVDDAVNVQSMLPVSDKNEAESCVDKLINKWRRTNVNPLPASYYDVFRAVTGGITHFYDHRPLVMPAVAVRELRRREQCFQTAIQSIREEKLQLHPTIEVLSELVQLSEQLRRFHQHDGAHSVPLSRGSPAPPAPSPLRFDLRLHFDREDLAALEYRLMVLLAKEHAISQKLQRIEEILGRDARSRAAPAKNKKRKAGRWNVEEQ